MYGVVIPTRNRGWYRTETFMVRYNNLDEFSEVTVNPAFLKKLNKFTVGQIIQIKSDDSTVEEINKEFGKIHEDFEKVDISLLLTFLMACLRKLFILFFRLKGWLAE